jgi:hypothetical protein
LTYDRSLANSEVTITQVVTKNVNGFNVEETYSVTVMLDDDDSIVGMIGGDQEIDWIPFAIFIIALIIAAGLLIAGRPLIGVIVAVAGIAVFIITWGSIF